MSSRYYEPFLRRHLANPILTAADWPYLANTVFNPGATLLPDGSTLLLCRVEDHRGFSHLAVARSQDGVGGWVIDAEPAISPDLRRWGGGKVMLEARDGGWWDANKIGLSPPPIETPAGWLMIYHGVRHTVSGALYRLGLALFDLEQPERCLLRGEPWVFGPAAPYARVGDVNNVAFPCGYTIRPDGDTCYIYYGGADSCVVLATASIREMLAWLGANGRPVG